VIEVGVTCQSLGIPSDISPFSALTRRRITEAREGHGGGHNGQVLMHRKTETINKK